MSSTLVSALPGPSRSRYQSISARSVSSSSRTSELNCSRSSLGSALRITSISANRGARSGPEPSRGGASPEPGGVQVSQSTSSHLGGGGVSPPSGGVVCRYSVIASLEKDLERAALEARRARPVGGHRGRQDDSALLAAHPHDHLEADLLQVDVRLLHER